VAAVAIRDESGKEIGQVFVDLGMNEQSKRGALHEDLRHLVRRFSSVESGDLIANVLMTHALLVHLRSVNVEEAVRRMQSYVDGLDLTLSPRKAVG
jgi:hypothetical protein